MGGPGGGWGGGGGAATNSRDFLDLVKSIGEARSKAEEDRIILREIESLKRRINDPDVPRRKMKEYILRLVYVEMLGHDASFGYIHAVKMTHDDSLVLKRTGYLAVTLFLNEDHDLIILIVNTIQKDLRSDNYLVVSAALTAVCRLINEETIPAVLPQVVELLGHPKEAVRKKAVMALHRFYQKSSASVSHLLTNFRKRLCDNDPGVMGASLCPLFNLITEDVGSYKDLVMSFVNILKQVTEKRLPKIYEYHQIPAPFIQIKLLKILALLGSSDKHSSEGMYTILSDIFRKTESTSNIGNAILYECVCCVSSIFPSTKLLGTAAEVTSKFLKNESHNLKYLGIDALGRLFKINPEIAEEHQLAVIDCLEDPDDTLKRKTFDLLYKMTKSTNVEVIVDRMIDYMISITDSHYKTEIASRCVELAEQFAPSNQWFIQTMNKVFENAGDLVNVRVAHNLMRLIAEGFGDDDEDSQLRSFAVDSYLRIIGDPKLPSIFLQVICWVLGEYGTADGKHTAAYIAGKLYDVMEAHSNDDIVKGYAVTAIMKIYAFEISAGRKVDLLPECQSVIDELSASHSTDLQQRAYEFQALLYLDAQAIENIMPFDASCEDIEVDRTLPFLDGFVRKSLDAGARPYIPENERSGISNVATQDRSATPGHTLRFEAYELPKPSPVKPPASVVPATALVPTESAYYKEPAQTSHTFHATVSDVPSSDSGGLKLRLDGVQKKWGRPTYSSPVPSGSSSASQKSTNGTSDVDASGTAGLQVRNPSYDARKQQVEVSAEKQRLAASLFGSLSARNEKKTESTSKTTKGHPATAVKSNVAVAKVVTSAESSDVKAQPAHPAPDLLDLGDGPAPVAAPSRDPFEQLEGLLGPNESSLNLNSSKPSPSTVDVMALFGPEPSSGPTAAASNPASTSLYHIDADDFLTIPPTKKKGPNLQDALEKDAIARQVGVTPSVRNPNLFSDLLG